MFQQSDHKTGTGRKTALRIGAGLAALAIAGAVGGCGSSKTSGSASSGGAGGASGTDPVATSSAVAATGSGPFAFGKTYSDGTETIKVAEPVRFTPSTEAVGYTSGDEAYYVAVTVGNPGSRPLGVSTLELTATVGGAGAKAANIVDTGTAALGTTYGLAPPFVTDIPAGATSTGMVAYDVPAADAGKLTIDIINLAAHAEWTGPLS